MYFNCFSYAYENKDDYLHCSTDEKLFAMLQRLAVFSQSGKGRNWWPGQTPKPKFCQKLQGRDMNPPPLAGHHTCFSFSVFQMCLHCPCPSGFSMPFTTYGNDIFKECFFWDGKKWEVSCN